MSEKELSNLEGRHIQPNRHDRHEEGSIGAGSSLYQDHHTQIRSGLNGEHRGRQHPPYDIEGGAQHMTAREKLVKLIKEGDPDTIERLGLAVAVINLGKQDQFEEARRDGCGEEWLERFKAEHPNYWNLI